jgi:hypothetical protein
MKLANPDNTPALTLINDALQRLGKARLSLDLAKDLMVRGEDELTNASDRIASAAIELRDLVNRSK